MTLAIAAPSSSPVATASSGASNAATHEDFTFDDFISIVNPLQHIPVVSTIYRAITGDTIKPFERVVGDTLYGGVWGFASGVANVVFEGVTGKDFGATALALLEGTNDSTNVANATPANTNDAPANTNSASAQAASSAPANSVIADASSAEPAANGPPRALQPQPMQVADSGTLALMASLSGQDVGSDVAQRALSAYQRSLAIAPGQTSPIF